MLSLQQSGCHNINFVTPSHQVHASYTTRVAMIPLKPSGSLMVFLTSTCRTSNSWIRSRRPRLPMPTTIRR
jgi:hypothetical protein